MRMPLGAWQLGKGRGGGGLKEEPCSRVRDPQCGHRPFFPVSKETEALLPHGVTMLGAEDVFRVGVCNESVKDGDTLGWGVSMLC